MTSEQPMTLWFALQTKWLRSIQQAVEQALSGSGQDAASAVSSSGHKPEPPDCRTASYTFYKEGRLKEATYEGSWCCGKPSGRLELCTLRDGVQTRARTAELRGLFSGAC